MSYSTVAFYIAAHHEDRGSFRGQRVSATIANPKTKVVFIYATAGGDGDPDRWWEARAQQGTHTAAEISLPTEPITTYVAQIKGHPMVVYESGNCVTYCLRLPSGNFDGSSATERDESLTKLRTWKPAHPGDQPCPLHAVDGSTAYRSWQDFCATLAGILSYERQGICQLHPWINSHDYCPPHPAADHADHQAVAEAVRFFARNEFYNRAWWLTACTANDLTDGLARRRSRFLPDNDEIERKTAEIPAFYEKHYRRLVPWYQFDLDTPSELHNCP